MTRSNMIARLNAKKEEKLNKQIQKEIIEPEQQVEPKIIAIAQEPEPKIEQSEPKPEIKNEEKTTTTLHVNPEIEKQLAKIYKEASPFQAPLSKVELLDFIYTELIGSQDLQNRAKTKAQSLYPIIDTNTRYKHYGTGNQKIRIAVRIPIQMKDYITQFYDETTETSWSLFAAWIATDWEYIKTNLSYQRNQN